MTHADPAATPAKLQFEEEPGSARSKWAAAILGLCLLAWMASGYILPAPPRDEATPVEPVEAVTVAVRESAAEGVAQVFAAAGQAEPDRRASLRSEASGVVAAFGAERGDYLEQGDVIARLGTREQDARVEQARQELARARREFENAEALLERGVATLDRVAQARSSLAAAEAELTQAEESVDATIIRAPFAGRLASLDLDEGSYVSTGAEIGTMLDIDPLVVVVQVPQQALAQVLEGQEATVSFITGEERTGTVDYVSADADAETRTFRAEILVPNPKGEIASGLSVRVRILTGEMAAHFVSPAVLSLDADGRLGVKVVDEHNRVAFHEVNIVRAQTDGIWVSGLPESVRIITIGQGFVREGETVTPVTEEEAGAATGVGVTDAAGMENAQ